MTVAGDLLNRLSALGFECTPDPPAIVVRYLWGSQPPPDALPVLEELRLHKRAVLAALTARSGNRATTGGRGSRPPQRPGRCDDWPSCWDWTKRHRPDLYAAVDDALDAAFDDDQAWQLLPAAIEAAADAYQARPAAERQAVAT